MIAKNKKCSRNFGFDVHPVRCRHLWAAASVRWDGPSRHGPRGQPGDRLRANRSWAHTAVPSFARSRAVRSSSTRSTRGPRGKGTLSLSLSLDPSARTSGEDNQPAACGHMCFQPDVHHGHDDPALSGGAKQQLVPDGTWSVASHLWTCTPLEKVFLVIPTRGTVSSFLFSIFSLCSGCLDENC